MSPVTGFAPTRRALGACIALAVAVGLLTLAGSPASAATTWQPPSAVSGSVEDVYEQQVVLSADGQRSTSVWSGLDAFGKWFVQTASSSDGGATWSTPQDLYRGETVVNTPEVVGSSNGRTLVAAWRGETGGGDAALMTRSSTDGGATWSETTPAFTTPKPKMVFETNLTISTDGKAVTVVYADVYFVSQTTYGDVYAVTSTDHGLTWPNPIRVSPNGKVSSDAQIATSASGKDQVVAWTESASPGPRIGYRRSSDTGATWTDAEYFRGSRDTNITPAVTMSADGKTLHLMWVTSEYDVAQSMAVNSSTDGGTTWTGVQEFGEAVYVGRPHLAASSDGSKVTVIWQAREPGDVTLIRSSSTTDSGATWSAPRSMTPNDEPGYEPQVSASSDGSKVTATWQTNPGGNRPSTRAVLTSVVLATSSTNSGADWEPVSTLSDPAKFAVFSRVAVSQDGYSLVSTWILGDARNTGPSTRDAIPTAVLQAARGSTPRPPAPTPTPTPTPAPAKKAQAPASGKGKPPARVKRKGVTVITGRNARTNAGQPIRTRVRCIPLKSAAAGETRYCTVIRGNKGKVSLRTYGKPVRVIVVQRAAPTAEYKRYIKRTVYVVR